MEKSQLEATLGLRPITVTVNNGIREKEVTREEFVHEWSTQLSDLFYLADSHPGIDEVKNIIENVKRLAEAKFYRLHRLQSKRRA